MAGLTTLVGRALPSRPCRRSLAALLVWSGLCYLLFRVGSRPDDHLVAAGGGGASNSRELLARVLSGADNTSTLPTVSTTATTEFNALEASPAVDNSPKLNETDLVLRLQPQMPNLPLVYWQENKNKKLNKNTTCAKFPSVYDLHFNNIYWQVTETTNGTFYLYGAYLDVRPKNRLGPTVRILGMINRLQPKVKTYCQLWFKDNKEPVFSKVLEYKYIWYKKWGNYKQGTLQVICHLRRSFMPPSPPHLP